MQRDCKLRISRSALGPRDPNLWEPRTRRGVTLLEMILALALTAIVLVLISQAVHLHLSVFDVGRSEIEQPQVARAVLRYIAADLRNAVRSTAADAAGGGPAMAAGNSGSANASTTSPSTSSSKQSTGSSGTQKSTGTKNASTTKNTNTGANTNADAAGSTPSLDVAGLYGSQYELHIDVSRPPRVDQYTPASVASGTGAPPDIPSDVKTVSYFLNSGGTAGTAGATGSPGANGTTGLYRREQDRAVTSYASKGSGGSAGGSSGSGDSSSGSGDTSGQLLAPEVNRLEFRYFDGTSWVTDWDSQQQGGLPMAVEITLGIDPTVGVNAAAGGPTAVPGMTATDTDEFTYRLVVRVPVAEQLATTGTSTSNNAQGDLAP